MDQSKIFNSAQGMLESAKELENFDKSLSDICLFMAHKLLRVVECCQPQEEKPSGDIKQAYTSRKETPTQESVVSFQTVNDALKAGVGEDQICIGHGSSPKSQCTGHGPDLKGQAIGTGPPGNPEKEVKNLVDKIRSKMEK